MGLEICSSVLQEMNVSKGTLGHLPDYLLSQTRPTQVRISGGEHPGVALCTSRILGKVSKLLFV